MTRCLKKRDAHVDKHEPMVEINPDKVNVELPSPVTGTVKELLVEEGAVVVIGTPLAIIEEVAGETAAEAGAPPPAEAAAPPRQVGAARAPAPGRRAESRSTPRVRKLAQ